MVDAALRLAGSFWYSLFSCQRIASNFNLDSVFAFDAADFEKREFHRS